MIGVEMVKDKETKEMAKQETDGIILECLQRGLLLLPCGPNGIRFSPALIITEAQADAAFEIFAEALRKVERGKV
jgi:4-aminobutyrate aminotransferase-like enzyme